MRTTRHHDVVVLTGHRGAPPRGLRECIQRIPGPGPRAHSRPSYSWSPTAPELRAPHDAVPFLMRNPGLSPRLLVSRRAAAVFGLCWSRGCLLGRGATGLQSSETSRRPPLHRLAGCSRYGARSSVGTAATYESEVSGHGGQRIGRAGDRREQGYRTGVHPRSGRPGRSQGVCGRPRPRERPGAGGRDAASRCHRRGPGRGCGGGGVRRDHRDQQRRHPGRAKPVGRDLWRARDASWR